MLDGESCLDYLFSSNKITVAKTLENFSSDHIPIKFKVETGKDKKVKSNMVLRKLVINNSESLKTLIQDDKWPNCVAKDTVKLIWKRIYIRPKKSKCTAKSKKSLND